MKTFLAMLALISQPKEKEYMTMKTKMILPALMALALGVAVGVTGCSKSEHEHSAGEQPGHEHGAAATKYTCPMHPEVVQDKASDCPKCGMKLVEKK